MKSSLVNWLARCAAVICVLALAAKAEAVTRTIQPGILQNDENRPYFPAGYMNLAGETFNNPAGISGTATPFVDSVSSVTGTGLEVAGTSSLPDLSDGNNIPIGVRLTYDLSFTVQTTGADSTLSDGGNNGLAVSSPLEGATASQRINAGEQLLFTDIVVSNVSAIDPLGLLEPGTVTGSNALWRSLRSNDMNTTTRVTTSSDAGMTMDVTMFGGSGNPQIENNFSSGVFTTPIPTVYVTHTAGGAFRLKGIGYQADLSFELVPTEPAERRTFKFFDLAGAYDNQPTHSITDRDTSVTITPIAPPPGEGQQPTVLDTNTTGVGVLSQSDIDLALGEDGARRIAGDRGEAIHFSFSRDVSLESITLGNPNFDPLLGGETMVLSFVSGVNPFESLTGYSGDYLLADVDPVVVGFDSLSFTNNDPKADNPLLVPFGMDGQGEIIVAADTVLSLTSANVQENGILLNMITANLLEIPELDGDYNGNGIVDAADYTVWQDTLGSTTDLAADGNGNNEIDAGDYEVWKTNFGASAGTGALTNGIVPEPASIAMLVAGLLSLVYCRRFRE